MHKISTQTHAQTMSETTTTTKRGTKVLIIKEKNTKITLRMYDLMTENIQKQQWNWIENTITYKDN